VESAFGKSIVNRGRFSLREVDFGCGISSSGIYQVT